MRRVGNLDLHANKRGMRIGGALAIALLLAMGVSTAAAFQFDTGCPDWQVRWDNTLKYSSGIRVDKQSSALLSGINGDDGDRNFKVGFMSNRVDLLSEMDLAYKKSFGFRFSGAGWVDAEYLTNNGNNSPATFNGLGPHNQFASATREMSGGTGELLDAFMWDNGNVCSIPVDFKLGRHTLLWGEALFFADNGIMYGQAPIDILKALSVPATEAKELFMPVGQFSFQIQPTKTFAVVGFLDFEWRRDRLPPAGSYYSNGDLLDAGGERILLGPNPPGGLGPALWRGNDLGGGPNTGGFGVLNFGQGGVAVKLRVEQLDTDFGLYWYRYNEKSPQLYVYPGLNANPAVGRFGEYALVFPEGIEMLGWSFGTQVGAVNVSGEMSARINTPLISSPQTVLPGMQADNSDHPLYAVGNTLHGSLSAIYIFPAGPALGCWHLWDGGTVLGEFAWNNLLNVTKNEAARDPTRDNFATGFRGLFQPAYYQVFPNFDVTASFGLGYVFAGKSPVDPKFDNCDGAHAGDFSVGLLGTYMAVWNVGITYTNYFGGAGSQVLGDRDNISIYIQHTF